MEAKSKQSAAHKQTTENFIKEIRLKTRKLYSSEQKILIVMEALRGEESAAAICCKLGIVESMFYKGNKIVYGSWQETPGRCYNTGNNK